MSINPDIILTRLQQTHPSYAKSTIWVAYSGGMDSETLLHLFNDIRLKHPSITLKAMHINHQLSDSSNQWQTHCQQTCNNLNISLIIEKITLPANHGIELAARELRHQCFIKHLKKGDILLMAHHQKDRVETFLYHSFKGSGLKGLCSIPITRKLSHASIYRPLLKHGHDELIEYANKHKLVWVYDESNAQVKFSRNYIRHKLLPIINERWPAALSSIARTIDHCAEARQLIDDFIQPILEERTQFNNTILSMAGMSYMPISLQNQIIHSWLDLCDIKRPKRTRRRNTGGTN